MLCRIPTVALAGFVSLVWIMPAGAQTPSSVVVDSPSYTSLVMEIDVDRPAADVWARVGGYCDIGEWLRIDCEIVSGDGVEVGTV